jgi:biotin transport system substrate-specific component
MQALLRREFVSDKAVAGCWLTVAFMTMTILSGFVRIPVPMSPVPVTLQTFFVLLAGASLGSWRGSVSQLGYLALGISGLPVFSTAGSGLLYIAGPSGGYMAGFVLAAFFVGRTVRSCGSSYACLFILFAAAEAVVLFSGAVWLRVLTGFGPFKLFQIGVLPFVPGDILKAAAAAAVYKAIRPRLEKILF